MSASRYEAALSRFNELQALVAKLNKRAAKFNMPPLELHVVREFHRQGKVTTVEQGDRGLYEKTRAAVVPMVEFTLEGDNPIIYGWQVLSVLEHVAGGTLVFPVGDAAIPERYKTAGPDCDHCKLKRDRNTTFVLKNEDSGKVMQVGSSCLVDFVGREDALAKAQWAHEVGAFIYELGRGDDSGEEQERGARHEPAWDMTTVLDVTAAVIRQRNAGVYVSKNEAEDTMYLPAHQRKFATVDLVWDYLVDPKAVITVDEQDVKQALRVREFVARLSEKPSEARSSFEHNLVVAMRPTYVTRKTLGFVVASFAAFSREERARRRDEEEARRLARGVGHHVGTVGERAVFKGLLMLLRVIPIEGVYGTTYLHHFEDPEGNLLVWFGSQELPSKPHEEGEPQPEAAVPGQTFDVKATVKGHEWYSKTARRSFKSDPPLDAVPQTMLSRVQLNVEKPKKAKGKKTNPCVYEDAG